MSLLLRIGNNILLGVALAMDAFSISLANGLESPHMPRRRAVRIAGVFAFFQIVMPLIGWISIHTIATAFRAFTAWIPWIALALLLFLGGRMIVDGIRDVRTGRRLAAAEAADGDVDAPAAADSNGTERREMRFGLLLLQGIATSIDALSVGFTIAEDPLPLALLAAAIIGAVTFGLCLMGVALGRRFGTRLAGRATILGGCILVGIGIEIFVKGVFF